MRWPFTSLAGAKHQPVTFGLVPEDGCLARRAGVAGQIPVGSGDDAWAIALVRQFHNPLNFRLIPAVLPLARRWESPRLLLADLRRSRWAPLPRLSGRCRPRRSLGEGAGRGKDDLRCHSRKSRRQFGMAIERQDRKSTRLNSSHGYISYAVFCLKKKKNA